MSAALASNVIAFPTRDDGFTPLRAEGEAAPNLGRFRRAYTDYASIKADEIEECREAWAYYYCDQIPPEVRRIWKARGQPEIVFPMVDQVADGAVGILAELRGDPKAFPRTQNNEDGAEVATQVVRSVLDQSAWDVLDTEVTRRLHVGGIAVAQIELVEGDQEDDDIKLTLVDEGFYYDPRSTKPDFSDARYMGVSKWATSEDVDELFPGAGEVVQGELETGETTTADLDRDTLWAHGRDRVRLVEHWYREKGVWRFCFYAGSVELASGPSPFVDDRGRPDCRFFAVANRIDHRGVHHGFHRRVKGPQDAINQHRSKAMHIMNTRQVKAKRGSEAGDNIEAVRKEAARPDGVFLYENDPNEVEVITQNTEFLQQTQYYQDAKEQLERFGPTQVALGDGDKSGRALAMLMRAGMAQLGPFVTNLKDWRLRIYRAVWAQAKHTWTNERIVRVTGDEESPQFLMLNRLAFDPMTGGRIENQLSAMNVDIIADEGPNTVNVMADVFDLMTTMVQSGFNTPPAVLIEMSGLPGSIKRKLIQMFSQPDPGAEAGNAAMLENKNADTRQKLATAEHRLAQARREALGIEIDELDATIRAHTPAVPQPQPAF